MINNTNWKKDYEITMTKEYNEVVDRMCDISGYYTEDYYAAKAELAAKDEEIAAKDEELAEKDRIIAEKDARYAEMMIRDGEPADKIERYTGLNIDVLKEIALSIGKKLVI